MDHAVVIGASMAGLLSAAALHRRYAKVTVLDRDTLPTADTHRKGVAQSRHAHGLLASGRAAMDELLPGLTAELVAQGALEGDILGRGRWIHGGHQHTRTDSGLTGLFVSRVLLEGQVRRRVAALPGVRVLPDRAVTGLLARQGQVSGVRLAGGDPIPADLVVDATGRGSRTPSWLSELGYEPPAEERVTIDLRYGTREFRRRPDQMDGDLVILLAPTPQVPRGGVALALEGERWVVTMAGYGDGGPPLPLDQFAAYARSLVTPDLYELVTMAEPIGEPRGYHTPASVRHRYERLSRFPEGLLVVGDAVCAFNPFYGQGMSVAAMEARALLDPDVRPLPFFRRVTKLLDAPWDIVVGGDLRLPGVQGQLTPRIRLVNTYLDRFHPAAAHDADLATRFIRVANLLEAPPSLLSPAALLRVFRNGAPRALPALV
ncbi:NAD(P)/FAD-dependent oxidoreductase [Nonomuraea rhizosphaerae]|uniref:NAD(P)/FAD-dependent oxidoreductase n=1 Tax=Nonomuraea rhizosphaerae TaxID=2665663 RepID=UPI001C5DEFAF|nr:tryptophan 7-halogenase [Nonomuraea rhizosphaerae]